ncbi:hypothetical protein GN958_ATG16068, partial [Phytophthora infestans]
MNKATRVSNRRWLASRSSQSSQEVWESGFKSHEQKAHIG